MPGAFLWVLSLILTMTLKQVLSLSPVCPAGDGGSEAEGLVQTHMSIKWLSWPFNLGVWSSESEETDGMNSNSSLGSDLTLEPWGGLRILTVWWAHDVLPGAMPRPGGQPRQGLSQN